MRNFFIRFNWSLIGKIGAILTIIGFVFMVLEKCSSSSHGVNIKATIQIIDYELPMTIKPKIGITYHTKIYKTLKDSLNINNEILKKDISKLMDEKSIDHKIKYSIEELVDDRYFKNIRVILDHLLHDFDVKDSISHFKYWNLAIINLKNEGNQELKDIEIEIEDIDNYGGYYEIVSNNNIIESSYFNKVVFIPNMRNDKEYTIRLWTDLHSELDDSISITHSEGKINTNRIIPTKGVYAWLSLHFNSFFDFYFFFLLPLFGLMYIVGVIYNYRTQNKTEE